MSMLGGIQPGRLRSYLAEALQDGPSNDGLVQRFQLLVWPDTEPGWEYVDRAPDEASEEQAALVFRKLVELDAEDPLRFRCGSASLPTRRNSSRNGWPNWRPKSAATNSIPLSSRT